MADTSSTNTGLVNQYSKKVDEFAKGNVTEAYKLWSQDDQYDKFLADIRYRGPQMAAEELEKLLKKDKDQVRIVDVGAGTGFVAIELRRVGYKRLDSVEPVPEMSKRARENNLYENFICDSLSAKPLNIEAETYDAAVCVGLLIPNHFPLESMAELLRITKTGGYIVIVGSGHQYYSLPEFHRDLAEEMHRLETENRMRIIKRELNNDYAFLGDPILRDGIVFVIQKI